MKLNQTLLPAIVAFCLPVVGFAQSVPPLINYQGRLTDAAGVSLPDGTYRVAFKVWNDATASSTNNPTHLIWGREYDLALIQGGFSLILGGGGGTLVPGAAVNDLSFAFGESNRFLGLTITQTPTATIAPNQQREILPRQQLLSVPFAVQAQQAQLAQQAQVASSLITNLANALCPPGSIVAYMGTNPPPGWLLCDGASVSRSQYATLFTVVGTSSGIGNGSTTFNLPDLRGLFLRGVNGTRTNFTQTGTNFVDPDSLLRTNGIAGGNSGNNVGSLQLEELKSHAHPMKVTGGGGVQYSSAVRVDGDGAVYIDINNLILPSGGSETRPKNAYVNYIIKY